MTEVEGEKVKKEHEPITWACFVVLLIASAAVLGNYVNDNFVQDTNVYAADGCTVVVNYTGAYYNYYGEDGAVVFDTSYYDIASDSSILKANEFVLNDEDEYGTISFTLGTTTTYLSDFMNATVGHHAGETVTVCIPAKDAYVAPDTVQTADSSVDQTAPLATTITAADFKGLYGYDLTGTAVVTTAYGWDAVATFDNATNLVYLSYQVEAGQQYTAYDGDFGTVITEVNSVSDNSVSYTMSVTKCVATGNVNSDGTYEIEMIQLDFGGSNVMYITAVDNVSSPGSFEYKDVDEKYNVALYFTISIVSVSEAD